jgi:hypothetical protein
MSSNRRIQSLKDQKDQYESQVAQLELLRTNCNQEIEGTTNADTRRQLRARIRNYSTEINELYDEIDNIEEEINKLESSLPESTSSNHLDNPKNQQELSIDKSLCYIDFKKALKTFETIQSQFNQDGDVALFFIEESLIKRGDLCLQRLRDNLKSNIHYLYRENFRYCPVIYTSGNLEAVVQGIANFFDIKNVETIELVIKKIGKSLQNDSVLFIEINCDVNDESEIDPLIPWFIENFWQPLKSKVNELTKDYEGIKVVVVLVSNFNINQRLLTDDLSRYYNNNYNCFARDKLVKIPLENWTKDDIFNWLKDVNRSLTKRKREEIASKIYKTTKGQPNTVCHALKQEWSTFINVPNSC